jgi:hypothetical protein
MLSNRLAFAALAIACMGAAAGGGYLATRQNTVPTPASAQTTAQAEPQRGAATAAPPREAIAPAATPVQETEAIVGDAARRTPETAAKPSVSKTVEAPARAAATRENHRMASAAAHQDAPARRQRAPQPPATPALQWSRARPPRRASTSGPRPNRRGRPIRRRARSPNWSSRAIR